MSSFDTSTNTGSTTFTNAFGTLELQASTSSPQKASGFYRTEGWRYFEFAIDDRGGAGYYQNLFVGIGTPENGATGVAHMYGGNDKRALLYGTGLNPPSPYTTPSEMHSFTANNGGVFMFAVDMTGQGRNHAGVKVASTIVNGVGDLLIPCVIDIGKDGVWPGKELKVYARPAYGMPMRSVPWAVRDIVAAESAPTAMVSLRVVSASYAYAVPTGMVAWGDGPEGVVVGPDDYALGWDPLFVNRGSLSGGNKYCLFTSTAEPTTAGYVMSTNLSGLTGKRYFEVGLTFASQAVQQCLQEAGLLDANVLTNTFADATKAINSLFWTPDGTKWKRGANNSASLTNVNLTPFNTSNYSMNGCGMMIDFDNKRTWCCQPYATNGTQRGPWVGHHSVSNSIYGVTPYSWGANASFKGIPISITAASSILRFAMKDRVQASPGMVWTFWINGGQSPFGFHPLLPGAKSMNGGRSVTPGRGDSWDVVNNPLSATYGAAGVSINMINYLNGAAQCAQVKQTGKQYFEIHLEQDWNVAGWYLGLRRELATTMTHANQANRIDQALVVQPLSGGGARWRYGVNIGSWTATASYTAAVSPAMAPWHGVAVDFDLGQMWVGQWNYNERTMHWGASSNPATGLNPHLTFTANERLRIFVSSGGSNLRRVNLVQDELNVVGLPAGFVVWGSTAAAGAGPGPAAADIRNIWPTGVMS